MKNLKFRIWDKRLEMFLPINDNGKFNPLWFQNKNKQIEEYIIQQFIGLKDKNGKEIFEGDIVNFTVLGWPHEIEPDCVKNAEVYFSIEDAMFAFGKFKTNDGLDYFYSFADRIDKNSLEVVGNVFENPGLLKIK